MNVKELIEALERLPSNARVLQLFDGEPRADVNIAYKARNGCVILSDCREVCYQTEYRPLNAPSAEINKYWKTNCGAKNGNAKQTSS